MRERDTLVRELRRVATCDRDAQVEWWKSLEPGEWELISFQFAETVDRACYWMSELGEVLRPWFARLHDFIVRLRREQLRQSLPAWLPGRLAGLVAEHCPACLLPELPLIEEREDG